MRVLHVVRPAKGGMRAHVERLLRGLPGQGILAGVAGPIEEGWDRELPEGGFIYETPIPDRMRPMPDYRAARMLVKAIDGFRPDILHAHGYRAAWIASLTLGFGKDRSLPLIVTAHNLFPRRSPLLGSLALQFVQRRVERWIAITQAVEASLERAGTPAARIAVIPNGIDADAVPRSNRISMRCGLGVPIDAPLVALVARLEPAKGVGDGLRAFTMLRRAHPSARLLVIGDGPEREDLLSLAERLSLRSSVRFLGWRDDATRILSAADACLIPSRTEGQSLVALEAMALGVPVVASAVGGLPEMIRDGETGLLAPPADPPALARALSRLLRDLSLRDRLVAVAGREVRDRWSEERMLRRTTLLYRAVLSKEAVMDQNADRREASGKSGSINDPTR